MENPNYNEIMMEELMHALDEQSMRDRIRSVFGGKKKNQKPNPTLKKVKIPQTKKRLKKKSGIPPYKITLKLVTKKELKPTPLKQ